jgi:L-tryptophan---pyruvate aminotransferase
MAAALRCAGRIGILATVAVNLAWIATYIRRRYFGGGNRSDNNGGGGEVEPSRGKPPVTSDSIVNLDQ